MNSPFDPAGKRHTAFAQVLVTPDLSDSNHNNYNKSDEIPSSELIVETKRSTGAGGQHVNTTDSAVRITHIPTGIVVSCQSERSQHLNRNTAMSMLKSKIWQHSQEVQKQIKQETTLGSGSNSWSHQIRTVTLAPYTLVKDSRSGYESSNVNSYLQAEILTDFMKSVLHSLSKHAD